MDETNLELVEYDTQHVKLNISKFVFSNTGS